MANEFIARNGIISQNNLVVSGSTCVSSLTSGSAVCAGANGQLTSFELIIPAGVFTSGSGTCSAPG